MLWMLLLLLLAPLLVRLLRLVLLLLLLPLLAPLRRQLLLLLPLLAPLRLLVLVLLLLLPLLAPLRVRLLRLGCFVAGRALLLRLHCAMASVVSRLVQLLLHVGRRLALVLLHVGRRRALVLVLVLLLWRRAVMLLLWVPPVAATCCRSRLLPGSAARVSRSSGLLGKVPRKRQHSSGMRLLVLRLLVRLLHLHLLLLLLRWRRLSPLHAGGDCIHSRRCLVGAAAPGRVRGRGASCCHCRCWRRGSSRWQASRRLILQLLHGPCIRRCHRRQQLALWPAPQALLAKGAGCSVCWLAPWEGGGAGADDGLQAARQGAAPLCCQVVQGALAGQVLAAGRAGRQRAGRSQLPPQSPQSRHSA